MRAISRSLPKFFEFDERDLARLALSEQQARAIDALEDEVRARGIRNDRDKLKSAIREVTDEDPGERRRSPAPWSSRGAIVGAGIAQATVPFA